jgi:hypothetical protein
MAEQQGAVRTNISLPRELKARMDAVKSPVNWSAVAAQAFEAKLLELESTKEVSSMDDVIARLKAAAELEDKQEYQRGFALGQGWAKQEATPKQLRRLEEYVNSFNDLDWFDVDSPGWNAPYGATGYFALAVMGLSPEEAQGAEEEQFWQKAIGFPTDRLLADADFFRGFGEGALAVWDLVQDKL